MFAELSAQSLRIRGRSHLCRRSGVANPNSHIEWRDEGILTLTGGAATHALHNLGLAREDAGFLVEVAFDTRVLEASLNGSAVSCRAPKVQARIVTPLDDEYLEIPPSDDLGFTR